MTEHNFKLSRTINGWDVELDHFGTPEDIATFITALDGIFGPAAQAAPTATAQPAASSGEAPICTVHNVAMSVSKYGGHYCTVKEDTGAWCDQKSKPPA